MSESVREALDTLSKTYREVLMLQYFGGMKSDEIAKVLGTSPTAIRMRLSRARAQLKEEMIAMMGTAFEGQRLQSGFTFRIVEAVKRIKINPVSTKGLPWGISLATGLLMTILIINPALISFNHIGMPIYSPLPVESKVLKVGEIPVDVVKTSNIAVISSKMGKGTGGEPENMQNAFFMAPKGEGGTWAKKADMPNARWGVASSVVNGKIYVIGGADFGQCVSTVEEYDPVTETWAEKAKMPTARIDLCTSEVNGKIYAIGGSISTGPAIAISTVEEYDPVLDKWTTKADMPSARNGFFTSVVNGKIYAIGGLVNINNNWVTLPNVEEYDPGADKWTRKADMLTATEAPSTIVVNDKIYAIGGCIDVTYFKTVEVYDPVADKWTKKADMPTAREYVRTNVINDKIYAIGGTNGGAGLSTVEIYDPVTDIWTKGIAMPTGRFFFTTSEVNGKIYAIGGCTNLSIPIPTVEEYTPEGWKEAVSPQGKLPKTWGNIKSR